MDGSATVNATGGTTGYSYAWPDGQATATATGLAAGTYEVTVTDDNGCTATAEVTIAEPMDALDITTTPADLMNPTCNGGTDGSIDITVLDGTAPYTYAWSSGDNVEDPSTLGAGTYEVTVTDANGCTIVGGTYELTEPAEAVLTVVSVVDADCGASTGEVTIGSDTAGDITVDGTTQAVGAGGQVTFTGLAAGLYTAEFVDGAGCTAEVSFVISNAGSDLEASATVTDVECNGESNGEVTISAMGGVGTLTYELLNTGDTNTDGGFTGLAAGSYTVLVSDENNCSFAVDFDVDQPTLLIASIISSSDVSCNGANDGTATVSATGGTTGYSYAWPDGQDTATAIGLSGGTYEVTVTDENDCTATAEVTIAEPAAALDITTTPATLMNPTCNGGTDGSIDITVLGGTAPYTYAWSSGDNVEDPSTLEAGTYEVTVTDANGCTIVGGTYELTEPAEAVLTVVSVVDADCGASTGEVTIGSDIAGSITVDGTTQPVGAGGQVTFTGLAAGLYTAEFVDGVGCTAEISFVISNAGSDLEASATVTDVACHGESNGEVAISAMGGVGTLTYELLNTGDTNTDGGFTGLAAGSYTVLVSDDNNCSFAVDFDVDEPTLLIASIISSSDVSCNGANDGTATVSATGGTTDYSYAWPDGQTTATATGLSGGTYEVTVTDANLCTTTAEVTIAEPAAALDITTTPAVLTNPTCNGGTDGSIDITVLGGTAPYTYAWSSGDNVEDPSTLSAGTYEVTVTDANGCTIVGGTYELTEPAQAILEVISVVDTDCGASEGEVTIGSDTAGDITVDGNTQPVGAGGQVTFTGLAAGLYTAEFVDAEAVRQKSAL